LIVLQSYYNEEALAAIDFASSFIEPADLDIPSQRFKYIDTDEPTRLELKAVLNATRNKKKLYSNYWRNTDFLLTDNIYN